MAARSVRARDRDSLAVSLGWFSIVLGTAEVAAPRAVCRLVGARDRGKAPVVVRAMGVRELVQGIGILARPRPTAWLWSRVAGDGLDLSLLGLVAAENAKRRTRTAIAIANVLAVTVPDVLESLHLSRKKGEPRAAQRLRKSITIAAAQDAVSSVVEADEELRLKVDGAGGRVRFAPAPGERGTEIIVEWEEAPPLGELGALAGKVSGRDLATQLADDLRRLKQRIETGEVVRSDAVTQGHSLGAQATQRPAQPLAEKEGVR